MSSTAIKKLFAAACHPYLQASRFAWYFAHGKLSRDPVFKNMLLLGLLPTEGNVRVLDIGCGQGLLASWLLTAQAQYAKKEWPLHWPTPPTVTHIHGIELMSRDVARAQRALQHAKDRATFEVANMCTANFGKADVVVILDVLHYVNYPAQDNVLKKVHACLPDNGVLLLRVGDADGGLQFSISKWVDNIVTLLRGHRTLPHYHRTLSNWQRDIAAIGFSVTPIPMNKGTPFANILLVCKKVVA